LQKHPCPWNFRIRCDGESCPLHDDRFSEILEVWTFTGRTPWSASLERNCHNPRTAENEALRKAEIARLFEFPERVQGMIAVGGMTRWICQDLKRARFLWNETEKGFSLRRAKQLYQRGKS
jgi:hypothetical protein